MKDLAAHALDAASGAGASYADVRAIESITQSVSTKNGQVGDLSQGESLGLGVRVIVDGAWGFSGTDEMSREGVAQCALKAVEIAAASATCKKGDLVLAPVEKHTAVWKGPCEEDPFDVPLSEKVDLLLKADAAARGVKGVTAMESSLQFGRERKIFLSTIGSDIEQIRTRSGAGFTVQAYANGELQSRSYPSSFGGQWQIRGFEMVRELDLPGHAPELAAQAVALLSAPQCESGVKDLVLESSQLALQIHESIGHPIELDRVLGTEANYAGTSFLTPDKLRNFRYGSKAMNIVADARLEHGPSLGTFGFDDEGVPAQRVPIITEGMFVGYLTSRETAPAVGEKKSGGAMRADGWSRLPLIRMTNISIEPGDAEFDELIAGTDDGIYMSTVRSWSIDDKRLNFQFGPEIGWEIKNGKLGRMVKNPSYGGITPEFWATLDAVCNRQQWTLWGVPNCGKGQPGQTMGVGHGAAPARFRGVKIGVAMKKK